MAIGPKRYRIKRLILFAGLFLYKDRIPSTEYEKRVEKHSKSFFKSTIFEITFVLTSFTFIIVGPIYVFIFKGEYVIPTGVILPFIDPDSPRGFLLNVGIQMSVIFVGVLAITGIEGTTCMIVNNFEAMADLTCFSMKQFSERLRHGKFDYADKMEFRDILVRLQDLEAYFAELKELYYWRFFLQPMITTGCVSLAIFAQYTVNLLKYTILPNDGD